MITYLSAATCTPEEVHHQILESVTPRGENYIFVGNDGRVEIFSAEYRLTDAMFYSKGGKFYSKIPAANPNSTSDYLGPNYMTKLSNMIRNAWSNNITGYLD